jgi:hypothetical protein
VVPIAKGFTHRFSPHDLELVGEQKFDVILRFGFNILRGEILNVPRYGIWSYHHGDNAYCRGGPAYFWEIYERHPLSGVILQVLSEELDAGLVLCKANLETQQGVSISRNRVQPYWTASFFVIRKLHQLHQYGWEHVVEQSSRAQLVPGRKKLYRTPTNQQMMWFLVDWVLPERYPFPPASRTPLLLASGLASGRESAAVGRSGPARLPMDQIAQRTLLCRPFFVRKGSKNMAFL